MFHLPDSEYRIQGVIPTACKISILSFDVVVPFILKSFVIKCLAKGRPNQPQPIMPIFLIGSYFLNGEYGIIKNERHRNVILRPFRYRKTKGFPTNRLMPRKWSIPIPLPSGNSNNKFRVCVVANIMCYELTPSSIFKIIVG